MNENELAKAILTYLDIDSNKVDEPVSDYCRNLRDVKTFNHCNIYTVGEAILWFNKHGCHPPGMRSRGWTAMIENLKTKQ
jgi:hypothetical protein